jgi:hypothetical protein
MMVSQLARERALAITLRPFLLHLALEPTHPFIGFIGGTASIGANDGTLSHTHTY